VAKTKTIAASSETEQNTNDTPLSFEASISALGQIVEQLERGDLPLEESLNLFEQGIRLSKDAQSKLDFAEKRVEMLLGFDEDDRPITSEPTPNGTRKGE
jgi:exodeoxyribonuclease VII small subunit